MVGNPECPRVRDIEDTERQALDLCFLDLLDVSAEFSEGGFLTYNETGTSNSESAEDFAPPREQTIC